MHLLLLHDIWLDNIGNYLQQSEKVWCHWLCHISLDDIRLAALSEFETEQILFTGKKCIRIGVIIFKMFILGGYLILSDIRYDKSHITVKLNFWLCFWQYTTPNEFFIYIYPLNVLVPYHEDSFSCGRDQMVIMICMWSNVLCTVVNLTKLGTRQFENIHNWKRICNGF